MATPLEHLRSLPRARLLALGGAALVLATLLSVGVATVLSPTYAPLYSGLAPATAGRMVDALEQSGFAVSISPDGGTLSVPREDVARARMTLAGSGLLAEGAPGWELFDEADGLGMSSFLQNVNRLRALEGELARSIQTIDGIVSARVHLVLPQREAFERTRPEASASVIVRSRPGAVLGIRQATAIRALVASAVPDLSPARITVLSGTGETILGQGAPGATEGDATLEGRRAAIEDRLTRRIEGLLAARVGAGNARVQVSVALNARRQVERSERFDPDGRVVRSTETRTESERDQGRARGAVGVSGNLPDPNAPPGSAPGPSSERQSSDEVVNYEIGSTRTETVTEPGAIERLSVAVLVDGVPGTDAAGEPVTVPRPEAEMARLAVLVRAAIGFDEGRGDTVSVESMEFARGTGAEGTDGSRPLSATILDMMPTALRGLFALAAIGLGLRFGLRPILAALAPPEPARAAQDEPAGALAGAAPGATPEPPAAPQTVGVPGVAGRVDGLRIEHARTVAAEDREAATRTLSGWIGAGA